MRSVVGMYFGIKNIGIIETKRRKIINSIQIPRESISEGELEEKVPEDLKLVTLIKNELRIGGIEAKDVAITLPGNDLIIRSFEINFLPKEELLTAVKFEAKKYIPFKTEDLISDFQLKPDKKIKKNLVLFLSIKKEIMDKYISVAEQLGLNIISIEYSVFSLLRLLNLIGVKKRGIFGIIDIDLEEETNFTVLEEGFSLFSRDINLALGLETQLQTPESVDFSSFLEKLKNEIRISLDYYRRKFPAKPMERLIAIANETHKNDIETLGSELGLSIEFIDIFKYLGRQAQFNMGSVKAYSASLTNSIRTPLRLNLLSVREKLSKIKVSEAELEVALPSPPIRLDYRFLLVSIAIVFLSFVIGLFQRLPLDKEIKDILNNRVKLTTLTSNKSYEELQTIYSEYNDKVTTLDNIIARGISLTEELNIIPSVLPEGTWLVELSFRQSVGEVELILNGYAFLGDRNKEFEAVNNISSNLKTNPVFSKTFKDIDIISLDRAKLKDWEVTNFIISCRTKKYGT